MVIIETLFFWKGVKLVDLFFDGEGVSRKERKGGGCRETLGDGGGWRRFSEREPASRSDATYQCSAVCRGNDVVHSRSIEAAG